MKNNSVGVAIIGCGRISGHHCNSILQTEGVELLAVCDLEIAKALAYEKQFGAKPYVNYHRMILENPKINTVAIVTPSGMHYEHSLDILNRYKKNLIVEKPTFMIPSQVREVFGKADELGLKVFPIFQNRYNKAVQRVKLGLINGELGKVRSISVRVRWCRPQRYYDLAPWRGTFAMDGGCLTNQGIHHIDLLRMFGGEVRKVCSIHKTLGANVEVEDTATAILEFESGIIGNLEITTAARPIDFEASISLVCENGLAQIGGIAVNELQVYTPNDEDCKKFSEDFSGNVYGNGHLKIYQDIANSIRNNTDYPISMQDTLNTIQLLNSFYISNETENWIVLGNSKDSGSLSRTDEKLSDLYRTIAE